MRMVSGMKDQLARELKSRRFIRSVEDASPNASDATLVRAVLVSHRGDLHF